QRDRTACASCPVVATGAVSDLCARLNVTFAWLGGGMSTLAIEEFGSCGQLQTWVFAAVMLACPSRFRRAHRLPAILCRQAGGVNKHDSASHTRIPSTRTVARLHNRGAAFSVLSCERESRISVLMDISEHA